MKIKICGIFREQDIDYINEARPDYCGFVFAESKRQVSPAQAASLRRRLAEGIAAVGVFVNAPIEEIISLYHDGVIEIAQLHGDEDETYIARLKDASGSTPIRVIQVIMDSFPEGFTQRRQGKKDAKTRGDFYLFDSGAGTGKTFDWGPLRSLDIDKPWFLAGGIGLDNIEQAMALKPFGIDVSSGAETDGIKDREKILQLVSMVRKGKTV